MIYPGIILWAVAKFGTPTEKGKILPPESKSREIGAVSDEARPDVIITPKSGLEILLMFLILGVIINVFASILQGIEYLIYGQ